MADIVEVIINSGEFQTLFELLKKAELVATLKGSGPFTLFAPTDQAFAKLSADDLGSLQSDAQKLGRVLSYHVAAGDYPVVEMMEMAEIKTIEGQPVKIETAGEQVRLNQAAVVKPNIKADNGLIHAIDAVLMPRLQLRELKEGETPSP